MNFLQDCADTFHLHSLKPPCCLILAWPQSLKALLLQVSGDTLLAIANILGNRYHDRPLALDVLSTVRTCPHRPTLG